MIDIESDVLDSVAVPLREKYPGIFVTGEELRAPAFEKSSIAVSIVEMDNSVYQKMRTATIENAAQVMYEVQVCSNRVGFKKSEAKEVMGFIDELLARLGFTRTMCNPISNLQDATIFRLVARYEAVVDNDLWIYSS